MFLTLLIGIAFTLFGVVYWSPFQETAQQASQLVSSNAPLEGIIEKYDLELAANYLKKSNPDQALEIIAQHQDSLDSNSSTSQHWLKLLVDASTQSLNIPQLVLIDEMCPEALLNNEQASLLAAEGYLMSDRDIEYQTLRQKWKNKELNPTAWLLMDGDHLISTGQVKEAKEHLINHQFDGKEETVRLIKLALLDTPSNPKTAIEYLDQAQATDPKNLDIAIYKAKIYEMTGNEELSLAEYTKALKDDPKNVYILDQLADLYLKNHLYSSAIATWEKGLSAQYSDSLWVKSIFWSRMTEAPRNNWKQLGNPSGELKPFITYLISLKPNQFWDAAEFAKLAHSEEYLETQQAAFWLRLISALKNRDQEAAWNLLQTNAHHEGSWNRPLELTLTQALSYLKTGELLRDSALITHEHLDNPLLEQLLSGTSLSEENQTLLKSDEAFSALFLAAGWPEPALEMHEMAILPDHIPTWYPYELAKAMLKNRDAHSALEFAKAQKAEWQLMLFTKELTARETLKAGDEFAAGQIYESIESESTEAKSYLARKAFQEKNWVKAKFLTQELLKLYPDNTLLQANLKKIEEEHAR